jgi:hypothetical protein
MKPILTLLALPLLLVACGGDDDAGSGSTGGSTAPPAELVVTVWADPAIGADPVVTTLPAPAAAVAADFDPPTDQACPEIYGGPGKATVTGTLADGTSVNGTFTRANGCEIGRWDRLVALGLIPKGLGSL